MNKDFRCKVDKKFREEINKVFKANKASKSIILVIVILLFAGTVLIITENVHKILCSDIYSIKFIQDNQFFSESVLSVWREENITFTYAVKVYPEVSNGIKISDISVIATNEDYRYFSNINS